MTKEELLNVYGYATALWQNFKLPPKEPDSPDPDLKGKLFDFAWYRALGEYDLKIVLVALEEHAKVSDFCNVSKVGELCKKFTEIANGTYIDEESVVSEIRKAISSNIKEVFDKLSPTAKEAVGGVWQLARWGSLQISEIETVVVSNIRKKVHNVIEKNRNYSVVKKLEEFKIKTNLLEE